MAKHPMPKSGGTSKFRMVVIDAELQEGEIGQLAQAIQGAFGGQRVAAIRLNGPAMTTQPGSHRNPRRAERHRGGRGRRSGSDFVGTREAEGTEEDPHAKPRRRLASG